MKCPECGKENQENAQFCTSCGRRFPRCPSCGMLLTQRARFCTRDGAPIPEDVLALIPEEEETPETNPEAILTTIADDLQDEEPLQAVCVRCGEPVAEGRKLCDDCRRELMQRKIEREALAQNGGRRFCVRCGNPCETPEQRICNACRNREGIEIPAEWTQSRRKSKIWLIVLILVLVLALIGGGIALASGGRDESEPQSTQQQRPEETEDNQPETEAAIPETEIFVDDPVISTQAPAETPTEAPTQAPAEEEPEGDQLAYLIDNCDKVYFTESDLQGLTADQCRIARNACYAKSGRKFKDAALQEFFEEFDWYTPRYSPDSFDSGLLNKYQEANIAQIKDYEAKKGY